MILKNYYYACKYVFQTFQTTTAISDAELKDLDGNDCSIIYAGTSTAQGNMMIQNSSLRNLLTFLRVGKGTGTVTPSDYSLFDDVTDSFTNLEMNSSYTVTNTGFTTTIICTGKNNTANDITLTEIGIGKQIWDGTDKNDILFVKSQLANPLTVGAGEDFVITVSWDESAS